MASRRFVNFRLRTLLATVTAVCLICAYVSNYLLALHPAIHITHTTGGLITGHRETDYRSDGQFVRVFFAPIHYVDRRVRPDYWQNWCAWDEDGDFEDLNLYREVPAEQHTDK